MSNIKSYEIGGITYEQRPLVLGQIRQLMTVLDGLQLNVAGGVRGVIADLLTTDRLERALAVVLTDADQSPAEKDLAALAKALEFTISVEQIAEVIEDFFTCNPAELILQRLAGIAPLLTASRATGSSKSSCSSPEETGASETASSGAASPTSTSPAGSNPANAT